MSPFSFSQIAQMSLIERFPRALTGLAIGLMTLAGIASAASARDVTLKTDRVFILMRHGVRAPIVGEMPAGTLTAHPMPAWPVAPEQITPHGAKALEIQARLDRRWLATRGVLTSDPCAQAVEVLVWTNTADRTIASGQAYGRALLPECPVAPKHQPIGTVDPLFEPLRASSMPFDPQAAIASINEYTGGVDVQARKYARALRTLDRMLGCGRASGCSPDVPDSLRPSADGKSVDLEGTIRNTSGTAQVLLLLYAEGLTGAGQAWPTIDPADLRLVGKLHSALFDIFTRPPYMAVRQAGPVARRLLNLFERKDPGAPTLDILIGHDTNVTALAALLQLRLVAPGYAEGDVAPGGAIIAERLSDRQGRRFVRLLYRTQSPRQLRELSRAYSMSRLELAGCTSGPDRTCPLEAFERLVESRLAR